MVLVQRTLTGGRDARIRVIGLAENSGLSAARNAALHVAQGQMVTYLDHDDEYFPDYLQSVMRHRQEGDVLVFDYDIVHEEAAHNSPHPNPLPGGEGTSSPLSAGEGTAGINPKSQVRNPTEIVKLMV